MTSFWKRIRLLLIITVLGITFITFNKVRISFHCTARTEVVDIVRNDNKNDPKNRKRQPPLNWFLNNVVIESKDSNWKYKYNGKYKGYFEFDRKNPISIRIVRYPVGDLMIIIKSKNNQIGTIWDEKTGSKIVLENRVLIKWEKSVLDKLDDRNFIIPVAGNILIGNIPIMEKGERNPILYYGEVTLRGLSYPSTMLFEIDRYKLEKGEEFSVTEYAFNKSSMSESYDVGYIVLDENKGFYIVFDTVGYEGQVRRYGGKGYTVSANILSRIRNDTVIQACWLCIISLFSVIELREKIFRFKRKE